MNAQAAFASFLLILAALSALAIFIKAAFNIGKADLPFGYLNLWLLAVSCAVAGLAILGTIPWPWSK